MWSDHFLHIYLLSCSICDCSNYLASAASYLLGPYLSLLNFHHIRQIHFRRHLLPWKRTLEGAPLANYFHSTATDCYNLTPHFPHIHHLQPTETSGSIIFGRLPASWWIAPTFGAWAVVHSLVVKKKTLSLHGETKWLASLRSERRYFPVQCHTSILHPHFDHSFRP